ncbi:glycosyltransferase family 2 protein [Tuwongella immobilis]|uniref:Glycosyltransferase 2-like domain-containing protein n=1 Tax=Tuwongella immobilis TaxID=692036 RepID=A0A6C2YU96_9BACT|nr:glycosyltransferase family 2 protein [Tuwongella immobilis]VIP04961.1 Putative glycosyltransferase OS=Methanocella conradii (strain DSM 24694 / JCM 17849 / CGMCC 1.5162 / HZ254) GN=Mtc_0609 PE=4 SV=1: Glyco_tranf_2_3 [Tuwongella immobilis]VTS07280.1 Putative glycosyltransferase OS=Methanocella conradii (strain DSM 24694 / JCM 17849 / CGMCC 1.5162 / HZ254) GN=Mtc_0609 PE=4 SV=1: Glyco_tranf_2_3 [Tuwongella immobilis]
MQSAPEFRPLISVVLVNYNGDRFLADCLDSLARQTWPRHLTEIILVDNASRDGSRDRITRDYPWVRLVPNPTNRGFAGGNNDGFAVAHGDWIALLNNDTIVEPTWLESLATFLLTHPEFTGVASKLVFHSEPTTLNSAGLHLKTDGRGSDRGYEQRDAGQYERPEEVFAGCGAAVLMRRESLDALGGFDERFFLYYEDLDLAWRARHRGDRFAYCPQSLVRHVHCGSTGEGSPLFTYYVERNRVLTAFKNADLPLAILSGIGFLARVVRSGLRMVTRRHDPLSRARFGSFAKALAYLMTHSWRFLADRQAIRRR